MGGFLNKKGDGNIPVMKNNRYVPENNKQVKKELSLSKKDVGLDNVDNTSDANKPLSKKIIEALFLKVDKLLKILTVHPLTGGGNLSKDLTISIPKADTTTDGYLSAADFTIFSDAIPIPSPLTRINDTNVTLTLGGSPTNALLQAVSLTVGWTGTLADGRIASATTWNNKVTSLSPGVGISIGGTTTVPVVTNTAPDQTVTITAGTGMSVSGTYPNFTITNTSPSSGGTVTSVGMSVPTGLTVTGSPITGSGTLAVTLTSGYVIPTTTEETNWNTAYTNRITSLTTTGSSGAATLSANVLNIPTYTADGLGAVPTSRTITINGTTYDMSANRSWTVAGGVTAYAAGGTVNAITASPGMTFSAGNTCAIVCAGYNTITNPTLATDGNTAKTITTRGGQPLQIGDITATTHIFEYNGTTFELLNPASEVPTIQNTITFVEEFNRPFSTTGFAVSASGTGAAGYIGSTFGKGNGAGWYGVRSGTTTTGRALCYCTPSSNEYFQLGNGLTIIEISSWQQKNGVLSAGADTFVAIAGMGTTLNSATQNSGIYVEYDTATNSSYWITTCANNGSRTRTASTFALPTSANDYFSFMIIVNAAGTSVDFYGRKNGGAWTLMNTMTTNIPANATTAQIFPLWGVFKTAGTNEAIASIDAFSWKTILTTPR